MLIDLPPNTAADRARRILARRHGARQAGSARRRAARGRALNDYTGWFAGDKDMAGNYFGYDGPCPPWNDEIVHHYVFTLYALDVPRVAVQGNFSGPDVLVAIAGHVLGQAAITGVYSLNPSVRP